MFKIISAIIYTSLAFVIFVLAMGYRAGDELDTSFYAQLPYDIDYIFNIFTDIERYPDRKDEMERLEILEKEGVHIKKWKEVYDNGSWREYELIEKKDPYIFRYNIIESSNSVTSEVEYYLEQDDKVTKIYLKEVGDIDNVWYRGWRKVTGDSFYLKREVKWLRVAILGEQLERP